MAYLLPLSIINKSLHTSFANQSLLAFTEATKYYASWTGGSHRTYTWDEADHECRRFGLRLVSLTSFEKETEISRLLNNAPFREYRRLVVWAWLT